MFTHFLPTSQTSYILFFPHASYSGEIEKIGQDSFIFQPSNLSASAPTCSTFCHIAGVCAGVVVVSILFFVCRAVLPAHPDPSA